MSDENYLEASEASVIAQAENKIAQVSSKAIPDTDLTPDQYRAFECDDCLVPLPEFRMKKGCRRCVLCQTAVERQEKLSQR